MKKAGAFISLIFALTVTLSARQGVDVSDILKRAGQRVTEYFTRAQSIMCLEKVSLQRLSFGMSAEGPARNGSRQGVWRCYRPDGSLREEGTYVNSLREGDWTEYGANDVQVRVVYEHGNVKSRQ